MAEREFKIEYGMDALEFPENDMDELNSIFEFVEENSETGKNGKLRFLERIIDFKDIVSANIQVSGNGGWGKFIVKISFCRKFKDKLSSSELTLFEFELSDNDTRAFIESRAGRHYFQSVVMFKLAKGLL